MNEIGSTPAKCGPTYDFFTRLYFDDALTQTVYTTAPYKSRGNPTTTNATDRTYGSDGAACLLALTGDNSTGYTGAHTFGLTVSGTAATSSTTSSGSTTTAGGSTSTTGASSGSTTSDTSVGVTLVSTKTARTVAGTRYVLLKLRTTEKSTVVARLKRGSKTMKKWTAKNVGVGTHKYRLTASNALAGGHTTLDLSVTVVARNTKHLTKIIHLSAKRS